MQIEIKALVCEYPIFKGLFRRRVGSVVAVDSVSLKIPEGKVVALVGESGSGKSSLARALVGLIKPTSGEILVSGRRMASFSKEELSRYRKSVQMVFQDPSASLNPRKTAFQSVGEVLLYSGAFSPGRAYIEEVLSLFERVGLSRALAGRYPHELSGGQQQRVSIARAIAPHPKLLILDEAVSALDISVRAQILNLLEDLKEDLGLSYLFITHDLSVVRHSADFVYIMQKGKIVEEGETEEIFESPRERYTKELLEAIPAIF